MVLRVRQFKLSKSNWTLILIVLSVVVIALTVFLSSHRESSENEQDNLDKWNNSSIRPIGNGAYIYSKSYEVGNFSIEKIGSYDLIKSDNLELHSEHTPLALPIDLISWTFPLNTIIYNLTYKFYDSEDLTLNLPSYSSYSSEGYGDRACDYVDEESRNASVDIQRQIQEHSMRFGIWINPFDIINCEDGKFRVYKKINYSFYYTPKEKAAIAYIKHPNSVGPNVYAKVNVTLFKVVPEEVDGFVVYMESKEKGINGAWEANITSSTATIPIEVYSGSADDSPMKRFYVAFLEIGATDPFPPLDSIDFTEFDLDVIGYALRPKMPETISQGEKLNINLIIENNFNEEKDVLVQVFSDEGVMWENAKNTEDTNNLWKIKPGANSFNIRLDTQNLEKGWHDLTISVMSWDQSDLYNGQFKIV